MRMALVLTCVSPALPLAQGIGRWGNWFNQERFGRPINLTWGLEVSADKTAQAGYAPGTVFHPKFLYESLWNLALCGALLYVDRRWPDRLKPGRLFAVYVAGYTFARFFIAHIRIDPARTIAGLRLNEWVAAIVFLGALGYLAIDGLVRPAPAGGEPSPPGSDRDRIGDPRISHPGGGTGSPGEAPAELAPAPPPLRRHDRHHACSGRTAPGFISTIETYVADNSACESCRRAPVASYGARGFGAPSPSAGFSRPHPWWPYGNAHRKVLTTGRLHQQPGAQPHSTRPISSVSRPMMAISR